MHLDGGRDEPQDQRGPLLVLQGFQPLAQIAQPALNIGAVHRQYRFPAALPGA
jgi:hypothetical protein